MKVLDLFSGIGGFSLGLERAGMETVAFCEIDEYCQKVLSKNFPNKKIFTDIKTITKDQINELGRIDIVCGGFPCQPFSIAGQKKGKADDRDLWPEMFRVIQTTMPTWVIGENVANFVNMEFTRTKVDLESVGYKVQPFIIPACAAGAQHRRDRVWIIAYLDSNGIRKQSEHECKCKGQRVSECTGQKEPTSNVDSNGLKSNSSLQTWDKNSRAGDFRNGEEEFTSNANNNGLNGETFATEEKNYKRVWQDSGWTEAASDFGYWWADQSGMGRAIYGFSNPSHIEFTREQGMDRTELVLNKIKSGSLKVNSETGDIYSRSIKGKEGDWVKLKASNMNGYLVHKLSFNGIKKVIKAHQIIWIASNGRVPSDLVIDHINRNKQDNRLSNLRLATSSENAKNKEFKPTKIPIELKYEIIELYESSDMTMREIASIYNISKSMVQQFTHEIRKQRIKALGNAVVPLIPEIIGRAIIEAESKVVRE